MKKVKGTVAIRWFLSYFLILLLPFVVSIGIFSYSYQVTTAQTARIYDSLMTQVQSDSDRKVHALKKTFDDIALNTTLQASAISSKHNRSKNPYLMLSATKELARLTQNNDYIENVFLYFEGGQTVASVKGHMSSDFFFDLYFPFEKNSSKDIRQFLRGSTGRSLMTVHTPLGEESLLFTAKIGGTPWQDTLVTAGIVIKKSAFERTLSNLKWDESVSLHIVDSNSQPLVSVVGAGNQAFDFSDLPETSDFIYKGSGNEMSAIKTIRSNVNDWRYVSVTPNSLLKESASSILRITIAGLILCTFLGLLLSYVFTRKSYAPLKKIMEVFSPSQEINQKSNEYEWIEQRAKTYVQELNETQHELGSHDREIRKYFIFRLLETPFDSRTSAKEMRRFNIFFEMPYTLVVYFTFRYDQIFLISSDFDKGKGALNFFVSNVFYETVEQQYPLQITDVGESIGAIINLPDGAPHRIEEIKEHMRFVQKLAKEQFGVKLFASLGNPHHGVEGVYLSAMEGKEALKYTSDNADRQIVLYSEIRDMQESYEYSIETEQKIISALRNASASEADALIKFVFDTNSPHLVGNMKKCLVFDLIGTIVKSIHLLGTPGLVEMIDFSALSGDKSERAFSDLVLEICKKSVERLQASPQSVRLSRAVSLYIEENFANPSLSVSSVGEHFSMTPAYLSALFKEQNGQSILDFINDVRVSAAKELLQKGESLVQIAPKTGFRNSGTLIRIFKKVEGVTPGQYKSITP